MAHNEITNSITRPDFKSTHLVECLRDAVDVEVFDGEGEIGGRAEDRHGDVRHQGDHLRLLQWQQLGASRLAKWMERESRNAEMRSESEDWKSINNRSVNQSRFNQGVSGRRQIQNQHWKVTNRSEEKFPDIECHLIENVLFSHSLLLFVYPHISPEKVVYWVRYYQQIIHGIQCIREATFSCLIKAGLFLLKKTNFAINLKKALFSAK